MRQLDVWFVGMVIVAVAYVGFTSLRDLNDGRVQTVVAQLVR